MAVQGTVVRNPWAARAAGLALTGAGAFLLKISVWDVLSAAERGERVTISMKATVLSPMFVVLGVAATYMAFTRENPRDWGHALTNPQTKRLSPLGWLVAALMIGAGFGLYFWVQSRLTALGYDV